MAENATIADVKKEVGDDVTAAVRAYTRERETDGRAQLLKHLKDVIVEGSELPGWAANGATSDRGARLQMKRSTLEVFQATAAYKTVKGFIEGDDAEHRATGVRMDTADARQIDRLADALYDAADEAWETSASDFRMLLRSSAISRKAAETARSWTPPEKKAKATGTKKAKATRAKGKKAPASKAKKATNGNGKKATTAKAKKAAATVTA